MTANADDIWAPYEETVTLTTVLPENAGIQWREGDSYDDNPWYRAYKERFNIQVVNDWTVPSDYTTKLNLSIADGSVPDVFFCNTQQQFQQLYEAGMICDVTDIYETWASDTLKSYMENDPDTFETAKREGRLYAIPQLHYGIIDQPNQIWVRGDWAEEAGFTGFQTMDDVAALAKTFMEKHGGYGITEYKDLECMKMLAPAWDAHPDIWVELADGTVGYGSVQPEMKAVLETMADWYAQGILNPDFTTYDTTKMSQDEISGVTGIAPYYQWWGDEPGPDVVANLGKEALFDAYEIPSANGQEVKASIKFPNYGYIVINKNCANPEAALKLINFFVYMSDDAKGKESTDFINDLFAQAYTTIPYALRVFNPNTDYEQYIQVTDALQKNAKGEEVNLEELGINVTKYLDCVEFLEKGTSSAAGAFAQVGSEHAAYKVSKKMLDGGQTVMDKLWGAAPESLSSLGSTLDDILKEGFTKIIAGEEPVSYFDTLVESWKQAGGDQVTADMNEAYGQK